MENSNCATQIRSGYELDYVVMDLHGTVAFRILVSILNIMAYDDITMTATECFLTWDILEDLMPFLAPHPVTYVDIQGRKSDLEQKVQELGLEKGQIVILINPSQIEVITKDSAALGYYFVRSAISSLLDPTRVIIHATMSNVREVGDYFLDGCSSLKKADLRGLHSLQEVGNGFLSACSSLEEVDLRGLRSVQKVGNGFLRGCSSLEEVDLSDLNNLQEVGDGFLHGCSSLTRVILPASPPECLRRAVFKVYSYVNT